MQNISIRDVKSPGSSLHKLHKDILFISLLHYKDINKAYLDLFCHQTRGIGLIVLLLTEYSWIFKKNFNTGKLKNASI